MDSKTCNTCRLDRPTDEFCKRRASPDGLNYRCRDCSKAYVAAWRERNPGAYKQWYAENIEHKSESYRAWADQNKARRSQYMSEWMVANRARLNSSRAQRTAGKLRAIPSWADKAAMAAIYQMASELTASTGVPHEVDHYYPLRGKTVCGLHCETNLRVITQAENISKLNRMPEEWRGLRGSPKAPAGQAAQA